MRMYEDAALRTSACRALHVLTASSDALKLVLVNHKATHAVLLQRLVSFDDTLQGTLPSQLLSAYCNLSDSVCSGSHDLACKHRLWPGTGPQGKDVCRFACSRYRCVHSVVAAEQSACRPCRLHFVVQHARWMRCQHHKGKSCVCGATAARMLMR